MALFNEVDVRGRARATVAKRGGVVTARNIIAQESISFSLEKNYDIFLSHSVKDAELVLGVKGMLEDLDYAVYVDWVDDHELDRSQVTAATAERLRLRMKNSKSLFCMTTENASASKWIPWECGYFDGAKEKVAILPVIARSTSNNDYVGHEYMGLYPYVVKGKSTLRKDMIWIHRNAREYKSFDQWVSAPNAAVSWQTAVSG